MGKERNYPGRLEFVLGIITFGFALLLSSAFLSQYVPPSYFVIFQWVGLCFPFLLIVNSVLLVFWVIRKRSWCFLPLIALLANVFYYPRIYQLSFSNQSKRDSVVDIVVASYNVHSFQLDYGGSSLANIAELMEEKHAQVLCLQEVPGDLDKKTLLNAFRFLPFISSTQTVEGSSNIVILSAFPIRRSQTISFPERANCAMTADLEVNGKSIRILTCHLQTTNWNQVKNTPDIERDFGMRFWHLFNIESVIERNYQYRASQADSLGKLIAKCPKPVIVCGDFNDPPISYTYRKMKGNLADSFQESGKGYAYTYRYLHKLFRIDYLFYSPTNLKANYYESPEVEYSDHKPIIIGLVWVN
jgi:endonuclease/exonuclease/phosphatase (EEP) superfamily protein YafD